MSTFTLPADNAGLPTFGQAKSSKALQAIAGVCTNTDEFAQLLNDATERLLYRGDWPGTEVPIQITVQNGVITFPRLVGSVRALNICNQAVPVFGDWYRFLPHTWSRGICCGVWNNWISGAPAPNLSQYGTGIQYAPIPTDTCALKVYCGADDVGQVIQLFGSDPSGNPLRTDNLNGTWSDGISIILNSPFVLDTRLVKFIGRMIKPVTQQAIQISSVDQVTGVETPIASVDASDTNPSYAQYRLHTRLNCVSPQPTFTAIALVKLKFIPVMVDADVVLIPNLHALKLFMQGIRFGEAGDRVNSLTYQADAVKELNLQMADVLPEEQIPITFNGFGTASPSRAGIGRII